MHSSGPRIQLGGPFSDRHFDYPNSFNPLYHTLTHPQEPLCSELSSLFTFPVQPDSATLSSLQRRRISLVRIHGTECGSFDDPPYRSWVMISISFSHCSSSHLSFRRRDSAAHCKFNACFILRRSLFWNAVESVSSTQGRVPHGSLSMVRSPPQLSPCRVA